MVRWCYLRSGRFLGSPSPQTPTMTNYFLFVTETQPSEGRGVFCYCSYQANLRPSPQVGHSLSWSLFFKSFNWGHWAFIGGLHLIFGLQNSHIMNPLGPFSGLVGAAHVDRCCPSSHNLTFISIVLRETWPHGRNFVHTHRHECF